MTDRLLNRTPTSKNSKQNGAATQVISEQQQAEINEKDEQITALSAQIDCLVGEVQNLSNIAEQLMFEQKLAKEKYVTLKSRYNTLAIGQQKEDIIGSNPYWKQSNEGTNAIRYNQNTKKEMYQLLRNANNTTLTSPRRAINSIGVLYKDNIISQQLLRDQLAELQNQLAASQLENVHLSNIISQSTANNLIGNQEPATTIEQDNQGSNLKQQQTAQSMVFSQYHSIDTMVQRYQDPV